MSTILGGLRRNNDCGGTQDNCASTQFEFGRCSNRLILLAGSGVKSTMLPVSYMAKRVSLRPEWLRAEQGIDVYSVSNCISKNFAEYIPYWQHYGYWFFDSPEIIQRLAYDHSLDLNGTNLFCYELHELEFSEYSRQWTPFQAEASFHTDVVAPAAKILTGFDVVTFSLRTSAECSPLSCTGLAVEVETNANCLLSSVKQAQSLLESGQFNNTEPGPFRIFAVYSVAWP